MKEYIHLTLFYTVVQTDAQHIQKHLQVFFRTHTHIHTFPFS